MNIGNKTYLEGTIKLNDGLHAICIDWRKGIVKEPFAYKTSTNWRIPEVKSWVIDKNDVKRSVETPIKEFEVYPQFMIYLIENSIFRKWIEYGGKVCRLHKYALEESRKTKGYVERLKKEIKRKLDEKCLEHFDLLIEMAQRLGINL